MKNKKYRNAWADNPKDRNQVFGWDCSQESHRKCNEDNRHQQTDEREPKDNCLAYQG